jgi:C4-dicarboxylate-binding protein DctP
MHEVQSHLTVSDHGYIGYAVIVNKKFWDGLPADIRTQLEGAMKDATKYTNAIAEQENTQALDAIKKQGKTEVYVLTAAEKAEWRKALAPVRKDVEGRVGKEVLNAVDKESAALGIK